MKKVNVNGVVKGAQNFFTKNAPTILTVTGVGGLIGAGVLAVKETPKALQLIEDEKNRINYELCKEARDNDLETCEQIDKLKPLDVVRVTWKCYALPVSLGVASSICIFGGNSINLRRNAALVTAYTLSESNLKNYRDKVVETIGEKKERTVREEVAKEEIAKNPVVTHEIISTGNGKTLFRDVVSKRDFYSDIETMRKHVNNLNYRMINGRDLYISLNDLYDEIGLDQMGYIGDALGWRIDQGAIEVDFHAIITDEGIPCIVLDFFNPPTYDYDKYI